MTRNEKKTAIENMAERFMSISDLEGKSMAIEEYLNLALRYCPEEDFNNKMSIPNNSILKDGKVKGGRS